MITVNNNFNLTGRWINEIDGRLHTSMPSVEFLFHNENTVTVKLNPGNQFHYNYTIQNKEDYFVLILHGDNNSETDIPSIFLFKIKDPNKLIVQFIDSDEQQSWIDDESELFTGILNRISID